MNDLERKLAMADPFPGAPAFFKRVDDEFNFIFGFSRRSTYAEDRALEQRAWTANREFPAECFSSICHEGEYGSVPLGVVEEISEAEFRTIARKALR